jgi:hypothetical protein
MKLLIAITALALTLTACSPEPTDNMSVAAASDGRVTVKRIAVMNDDLAYQNRRGVYVIVDNKTGREFIGVSGVGIAETGSHGSGKTHTNDER